MANKNIAVIPARRNSQGFRFKNRILFNETIDFLNKIKWFDEKIISTDDEVLIKKAKKFHLRVLKRSKKNSKNNISIKSVMKEVKEKIRPDSSDRIWLIYLRMAQQKIKTVHVRFLYNS